MFNNSFPRTATKSLLAIFLPLVALAIPADGGTRPVCLEVAPRLGRFHQPIPSPAPSLTATSLNLATETSFRKILRELERVRLLQSDLFFFQEVVLYPARGSLLIGRLAGHLGYDFLFAPAQRVGRNGAQGLAILSRYPLQNPKVVRLPRFVLKVNNRCRIALTATAATPLGAVGLVNLHLDTRINLKQRYRQLQPVLEAASELPQASVIAGDLNTQNFLWVENLLPLPFLHRQVRPVLARLEASGYSTPFTRTGRTHSWAPLKLDWIFLRELRAQAHRVQKIGFSDHRALWVQLAPDG
ncbi:MAG: endonuclease/exonuclease/phosphatase family protein [Acidobacteria bacterium]|nr:endonuclease/exonuclease/phosphatase family protein [Acidobacteriota bacterium]